MLSSVAHVSTVDDIGNGSSVQYDELQPRAFPQPRHTQPPTLPPVEEKGAGAAALLSWRITQLISHQIYKPQP